MRIFVKRKQRQRGGIEKQNLLQGRIVHLKKKRRKELKMLGSTKLSMLREKYFALSKFRLYYSFCMNVLVTFVLGTARPLGNWKFNFRYTVYWFMNYIICVGGAFGEWSEGLRKLCSVEWTDEKRRLKKWQGIRWAFFAKSFDTMKILQWKKSIERTHSYFKK